MFCNKCGKELPDNATFCSGCGNQVGAAPAAPAAAAAPAASLPPILGRLISQVANFFTKKDPVGVVANSAKDNSFSGAILAVFGMLMFALSFMVNVNQSILVAVKNAFGGDVEKEILDRYAKMFPSGTSFGMALLTAAVVFVVAALAVFLVSAYLLKKPVSLSGSINIVAYSSIPVVVVSILNMLFGLIWYALPLLLMLVALCATLTIMVSAFNKATGSEKTFAANMIIVCSVVLVGFIFMWLTLGAVEHAEYKKNEMAWISNIVRSAWLYKK